MLSCRTTTLWRQIMLSAKQAAQSAAELDESSTIDLDEHRPVYELLLEVRAKLADYGKIEEAAEGYLKSKMGDREVGLIDNKPVVSHKFTTRMVLSQRRLKERFPITALMCMQRKEVRTWRVLGSK
jgi:hypothetical protein